ncbi:MAG TPA: hypothetical protein PLF44_02245 [Candidatus Mcinerneyibacteriales bacterium]|jgi:hypothetical protein|nr:hypothetical protein [Candidatus Mcinerneyibacteriales bacterium]HPE20769.1 hypothetical protein [Candidatus Mcinerneyibacteriales bacterium]HPJ69678.1 hypothetical protein [Candidatus Mcinerneyibacteriales bacterium]HPQ88796.1 hypothetical protein [Candidatus Mcinerneyibacteriales bacterium]
MKQTVQMDKIQASMRRGVITLEGFLGTDTRKLVDILIDDDAEVRRLGMSHEAIARRMLELKQAGEAGLGEFVTVGEQLEVKVDAVRGKLPCPFGDPGIFGKVNTTVRNKKTKKEVTYTDLHIHMIWAHGFYEGKGSRFRLEPAELIDILEVKTDE